MKRMVLAVSLTAAIIASVIVAHAATLELDAGVLQTQTTDADVPIPELLTMTIKLAVFNDGGQLMENRSAEPFAVMVPEGVQYEIAWTGDANSGGLDDFECGPDDLDEFADHDDVWERVFTATGPRAHLVCLRHSGNRHASPDFVDLILHQNGGG